MNQQETEQFVQLYRLYRHEDQLTYYSKREAEFLNAQSQALWLSIGLIFLTALAGALESVALPWLKLLCLLIAASAPILSTAVTGYSTLYAFEQQAKLYRDARKNLEKIRAHLPQIQEGGDNTGFSEQVIHYVQDVEATFRAEQGFWGQLAQHMKTADG